ncbi:MAG: tetrathionate reductase family octaheme c-type cytochrome [Thermodesulfobacteriota bacterium]
MKSRRLIRGWLKTLPPLGLLILCLSSPALPAETADNDEAPGRTMARQAVGEKRHWNTTDHTQHAALGRDFTSGEEITAACLSCHNEADDQIHQSIHWTWKADPSPEGAEHGKAGLSINNYCISANRMKDKGCLQCHPGWNGKGVEDEINCLVCHGREKLNFNEAFEDYKYFIEAGDEESRQMAADIQQDIHAAVVTIGIPERENCGSCHFYGGGGDGVKHGDLDSSLTKPLKTLDVHMGTDGQNFDCVRCHTTRHHNIAGRVYTAPASKDRKSLIEDDLATKITCESCHTATPHKTNSKANDHTDRVACQSCHIPYFARVNPTKMSWDWSKAGDRKDGKPYTVKGPLGKETYLSIKGEMVWEKNVKPEYFWYNGSIRSVTAKDVIDPIATIAVSQPEGGRGDVHSRIYPFKVHRGNQPYDQVNKTLLAPIVTGPNGYFTLMDWEKAFTLGMEALGLPYSGQFDFVKTTYVFPTTHMVAPKSNVVSCKECHRRTDSRLVNLAGFYMPGRDRYKAVDLIGWFVIAASIAGVALHGLGRVFAGGKRKEG